VSRRQTDREEVILTPHVLGSSLPDDPLEWKITHSFWFEKVLNLMQTPPALAVS
jgi:hypothetical protein